MDVCDLFDCTAPGTVPMVLSLRLDDGEQPIMVCDLHADWVQRMESAENAEGGR
ncbi:hypothetical protein NLU66_16450 [Brachybacterium sp. NBEC-018]|uniref:hypothetical protein n=1 Tax=Brachybacterium sp. NBEC-018 TaxID=2996004 RepID=UPI00217504D2|nr:hypothetical protein [Brachybacterium sp. NBEC-018]UVY83778.1 hypothetical protein NLU66_16450 [Brachybacterium sp. NBEC-018]